MEINSDAILCLGMGMFASIFGAACIIDLYDCETITKEQFIFAMKCMYGGIVQVSLLIQFGFTFPAFIPAIILVIFKLCKHFVPDSQEDKEYRRKGPS